VAGKTLDTVSSKVKSCAAGCASVDAQWEQYKVDFKKSYASDDDEAERKEIFKATLKRIEAGNALGPKVFGLTWTSDRKEHEKHAKQWYFRNWEAETLPKEFSGRVDGLDFLDVRPTTAVRNAPGDLEVLMHEY